MDPDIHVFTTPKKLDSSPKSPPKRRALEWRASKYSANQDPGRSLFCPPVGVPSFHTPTKRPRDYAPTAPRKKILANEFAKLQTECDDVISHMTSHMTSPILIFAIMPENNIHLHALNLKKELENFLTTHNDRHMTKVYTDALEYSTTYTNSLRDLGIIV
jgi:hypothetical protein